MSNKLVPTEEQKQRHQRCEDILREGLNLTDKDKKDLLSRGYHEWQLNSFRSVHNLNQFREKYLKESSLVQFLSPTEKLIQSNEGILCPIIGKNGLITSITVLGRSRGSLESSLSPTEPKPKKTGLLKTITPPKSPPIYQPEITHNLTKEDCLAELIEDSGIDREIVNLNFKFITGETAWNYLFYSDKIERTNTRRLSSYWLKLYSHIENGGWWASGIDVNTGEDSLWGCYKPATPRGDKTKEGKTIKYEHPPKTLTEAFFLRIPMRLWEQIAQKHQVPILPTDIDNSREDLGFWIWVSRHPEIEIIITEGVKKAATLLSLGFVAIGVPGIWGAYRKNDGHPTLIPQLLPFTQEGRTFGFAFDQDEKQKTRINNKKALGCTARLLIKHKCVVKVIEWNPLYKGVDDLIVQAGSNAFFASHKKALLYPEWISNSYWELNYKPDLILSQDDKYIGSFTIPKCAKLIGIKAPKGSGKTERLVEEVREARLRSQKVLVITHRVELGKILGKRFGLPHLSEILSEDIGGVFGFALCFDSLRHNSRAKFDPDDWKGCLVILDECEQSIWHLLDAKTEIAKHRVEVLRNFQAIIQGALNSEDGRVILSDADLSHVSINYIKSLAECQIQPWIAEKKGNPHPWKATFWEKPEELLEYIIYHLKSGGKVLLFTDGQKAKSTWSTQTIETFLKKLLPYLNILRTDRETISDPSASAYKITDNFDNAVQCVYKDGKILLDGDIVQGYDVVICSPVIETGISIDLKGYFTLVADISQGVTPVHSTLQRLDRLRDPIPRHIYAAKRGIGKIGNGSSNPKRLTEGLRNKARSHFYALNDSDYNFNSLTDFQPQSTLTWARMASRINQGMYHYRDNILRYLIKEGHPIEIGDYSKLTEEDDDSGNLKTDIPKDIPKEIKEAKDENYQQYCEAIVSSITPTNEQLKVLKNKSKGDMLIGERHQLRKGELAERYSPELISPELIKADDNNEHQKARTHYYLSQGRSFLKGREKNVLDKALESGEGKLFLPDTARNLIGGKIAALDWLEVSQLLHTKEIGEDGTVREKLWSKEDSLIQDIAAKCRKQPKLIKDVLGVTVNDKTPPIKLAQNILKQSLGLSLGGVVKRVGERNNQTRFYGSIQIPEQRKKILNTWQEKDKEALLQSLATESEVQQVTEYQEVNTTKYKDISTSKTDSYQIENQGVITIQMTDESSNSPPSAEPQITKIEELAERLKSCPSFQDFKTIADDLLSKGGCHQDIDDGILFTGNPLYRNKLYEWHRICKEQEQCHKDTLNVKNIEPQPEECHQKEWHWKQLPVIGTIVRWVENLGTERLTIKAVEPDGRCQLEGFGGTYWNSHIRRVMPASG